MNWARRPAARAALARWLQAPGSLSARLASTGVPFSVQLLAHGRGAMHAAEAQALGVHCGREAYLREVVLRVDGTAMVFARSVTLYRDSWGVWRSVRGLGTRPLADVLFTRPGVTRTSLTYARFPRSGALRRAVERRWRQAQEPTLKHEALPARRSVFMRQGRALLVTEVYAAHSSCWVWPSVPYRKHQLCWRRQ